MMDETLSNRYQTAHKVLIVVLILITLYGTGMVLVGSSVAIPLFDLLQFGPKAHGLKEKGTIEYVVFAFGVLGAVLIGWMVALAGMADLTVHPDSTVRSKARSAMAMSVGLWFVWDTGFSLAMGEWQHAFFNILFCIVILGPLYVMMWSDDDGADEKKEQ